MELPDNWEAISGNLRQSLADQLAKEIAEGHVLYGIKTEAVAARRGTDLDVLFHLRDGSNRYAVVHLTWSRLADSPPIPWSEVYDSYEEFVTHSKEHV